MAAVASIVGSGALYILLSRLSPSPSLCRSISIQPLIDSLVLTHIIAIRKNKNTNNESSSLSSLVLLQTTLHLLVVS